MGLKRQPTGHRATLATEDVSIVPGQETPFCFSTAPVGCVEDSPDRVVANAEKSTVFLTSASDSAMSSGYGLLEPSSVFKSLLVLLLSWLVWMVPE